MLIQQMVSASFGLASYTHKLVGPGFFEEIKADSPRPEPRRLLRLPGPQNVKGPRSGDTHMSIH